MVAGLLALLGTLGAGVGLAAPAVGHDGLTSSSPADGAAVPAPPASVDLDFSRPPLAIGAEVQVTGPEGAVVNGGDLTITGTTVSQPLAPELPAGEYAVAWRVTSSDGHPISGELAFTATAGTVPEPAPDEPAGDGPATATPPADEPADEPAEPAEEPAPAETAAEPAASAGADAGERGGESSEGSPSPLPVVLGGVVLLGASAAWWAARRRAAAGPRD